MVKQQTAWSVLLTISSSDELNYPTEIFVYQAETPADPNTRGWFTAVSSPAQLLEYPTDGPAVSSGDVQQPYYRLNTVELVSRNASDIELLVRQVYEEVDLLYLNLRALGQLEQPVIMLPPVHAAFDTWPGSAVLGPYAATTTAVQADVVFTSSEGDGMITFSSEPGADGQVQILDPVAWTFAIPEQPLFLTIGLWNWTMTVVDELGDSTQAFTGTIQGLY